MSIEVNPDEDFHVVVNGNVLALSLDALCAAYEGDVIQDESLIWQPGLGEWMRLDTILYHLEQQEPTETPAAEAPIPELGQDNYYVQVAEDEVKQMSLDQLDTAYRTDIIDLSTLVWQPGFAEWIPLAVVIGEEDGHHSLAPSLPAAVPAAASHTAPAPSVAPVASAPSAPSFAPQAASAPSVAPSAAPSLAPHSLSAVSSSMMPDVYDFETPAKGNPWYRRGLIAAAAVAGLTVAHRYGVGYEVAGADTYAASMGAPSTDTPYGLDRWLDEVEDKYALDQLSETEAVGTKAKSEQAAAPAQQEKTEEAKKEEQPQDKETDKPAAKKNQAVSAFGAALGNKPAPSTAKKSAPVRKYKAKKKSSSSSGMVKSGHAFDPMNGAL